MMPLCRIELQTFSLQVKRSTTELKGLWFLFAHKLSEGRYS